MKYVVFMILCLLALFLFLGIEVGMTHARHRDLCQTAGGLYLESTDQCFVGKELPLWD